MILSISISTDNEAFGQNPSHECARILRQLANRIDGHPHLSPGHDQALLDFNGNEVGYLTVLEDGVEDDGPDQADNIYRMGM